MFRRDCVVAANVPPRLHSREYLTIGLNCNHCIVLSISHGFRHILENYSGKFSALTAVFAFTAFLMYWLGSLQCDFVKVSFHVFHSQIFNQRPITYVYNIHLPQSCLSQVHKYCVGDVLAHHGRVWHMVCAVFGNYHHYRWEISCRNLSSVSRFRCDRWKLEGGTRLQRPRVRLCMDHHSNPLNAKLLPCQGRILVGEVHAAAVPIDGHLSGIDPPFLG